MSKSSKLKSWSNLKKHQVFLSDTHLRKTLTESKQRNENFSLEQNDFFLDYSKTHIDEKTITFLEKFAEDMKIKEKLKDLFAGERVNKTQNLPALHFAWRAKNSEDIRFEGRSVMPEIIETRNKMKQFCEDFHSGKKVGATGKRFLDIVHIGIGGSSLHVRYLAKALAKYKKAGLGIHFIECVDGVELNEIKKKLQPETTLFVIASKSFRTPETLLNASYVKEWIDDSLGTGAYRQHMIASTAKVKNAHQFGILDENTFAFKNWVVGRFAMSCPTSITIPLACGWDVFQGVLDGANSVDKLAQLPAIADFLPFKMAMISVWYRSFWNTTTEGVFPYLKSLEGITDIIQMIEVESNGKDSSSPTSPFLFGGTGSTIEHFLFQKYLQNSEKTLSTFIVSKEPFEKGQNELHTVTNAHAVGFSEALALGEPKTKDLEDCEVCIGNQPSMTLVLKNLSPETIGGLIALFEYKTICESFFWDINPFDNYGANAGKKIVQKILQKGKTDVSENIIEFLK